MNKYAALFIAMSLMGCNEEVIYRDVSTTGNSGAVDLTPLEPSAPVIKTVNIKKIAAISIARVNASYQ